MKTWEDDDIVGKSGFACGNQFLGSTFRVSSSIFLSFLKLGEDNFLLGLTEHFPDFLRLFQIKKN